MFKLISLLFTTVFLLLGLVLGVLNPHLVEFDLFFYHVQFPLGLAMAVMLVIGMLIGALLIKMQVTQLKWRLSKQTRLNQKQSDEMVHMKKQLHEAKQQKSLDAIQPANQNNQLPTP